MGTINFEEDDIVHCLAKAQEIREQYEMYVLHGNGYPKSVDDFIWICGEYLGFQFTIEQVDLPAEGCSIQAVFIAEGDGSYRIGVLSGLTDEDLRFVVCKELFHMIFDEPGRRSIALREHVENYTSNLPLDDAEPDCSAAWETLAEIAAVEFLFPYEERVRILAAPDGSVDFARIATTYGLPRIFVEVACGEGNMAYVASKIPA